MKIINFIIFCLITVNEARGPKRPPRPKVDKKFLKGLKSVGKLAEAAASSGALGPEAQLLSAAVKTAIVAGKDIAAGKSLATIAKDASKTAEQEALNAATGGGKEEFLGSLAVSAGAPPAAVGVIQGGSIKEQMKQQAVNMAEAQVANQINANPSVVPVVPLPVPVAVPVAQVAPAPEAPHQQVYPAQQQQQGAVTNLLPQSPGQQQQAAVNPNTGQQQGALPSAQIQIQQPQQITPNPVPKTTVYSIPVQISSNQTQIPATQQSQIPPAVQQLPPAAQFQQFPAVQQVQYSATGLPPQAATYPVTVQQPQNTATVVGPVPAQSAVTMQGTMYPVQQQQVTIPQVQQMISQGSPSVQQAQQPIALYPQQQLPQQAAVMYPATGQQQQAIQPQYYQSQPAA